MFRTLTILAAALTLGGCAGSLDRYMVKHPIGAALTTPDIDLACRSANGTRPIAASLSSKEHKNYRSMIILDTTAAACAQMAAMEAELEAERAMYALQGEAQLVAVKDARAVQRRQSTLAARRQWRAYQRLGRVMGPLGESCPKLRNREEELVWFIGILGGTMAVLGDSEGGGEVGVPIGVVKEVARAGTCLDDEDWWSVPSALQASVWAMIPGTAPEGVDPFDALEEAANRGETQGMHLARAIQMKVSSVAGRDDRVKEGILAFNEATRSPPAEFALLEDYARKMALHEADLLWTRAGGYRAPTLGELPGDGADDSPGSGADPFADDPFAEGGGDPFAEGGGDPYAEPTEDADPAPETP